MKLINYIRDIQDFPTQGIIFKDITPLLGDASAFAKASQELLELIGDQQIDKVVGVEARGFFFGGVLAEKLNAGFVPVRKPGKLPFTTASQSYALEYGTDTLEIHKDALPKYSKVLLVDDLLATGGTAIGAIELLEKINCKVLETCFIVDLPELGGGQKLHDNGHEFYKLVDFDGH